MREFDITDEGLTAALTTVMPHLDEHQRLILAGSPAGIVGWGGIVAMADATEVSRSALQMVVTEIAAGVEAGARVHLQGAGR